MHLIYVAREELRDFSNDFEFLEGYSLDFAHGDPQHHSWASILTRRSK
jgi:hypothetical protein